MTIESQTIPVNEEKSRIIEQVNLTWIGRTLTNFHSLISPRGTQRNDQVRSSHTLWNGTTAAQTKVGKDMEPWPKLKFQQKVRKYNALANGAKFPKPHPVDCHFSKS